MCVCANLVETEAMLEHGGRGGRSCYKTCHSLSSSRQQQILPRLDAMYRGQLWNMQNGV